MNQESVTLTFLGSGTSHGVPMIGCDCPTCLSADERDRRTNASVMLSVNGKVLLIDCGRDFRLQALRHRIPRVDYVLLTHIHFDHIAGLDDLRVYNQRQGSPIPVLGKAEHLEYLKRHPFHYMFDRIQEGGGVADLELIAVDGCFVLEGIVFEPLPIFHGRLEILGYRFLGCAYLSDVSCIPRETMARLHDLDLLILDALRYRPHATHFSLTEALEVVRQLRPRRTLLTHVCHDLRHAEVEDLLGGPDGPYHVPLPVGLAYDGLSLVV
jgi:phosphoribosyl 1,2-cyclic phosphate phosphodiesterase